MNITAKDRKLFKNIPESVPEHCTLDEAEGLNRYVWLEYANYGVDNETAFGGVLTIEHALNDYETKKLEEEGIVQFPLSDSFRYYPASGEKAYFHYFEEMARIPVPFIPNQCKIIQEAGEKLNKANKNAGLRGRLKSLFWAVLSAAIGGVVYYFRYSEFLNSYKLLQALLILPLVCPIVVIYNLWRVFFPKPEAKDAADDAKMELRLAYEAALRYIRLRVLWYQAISDSDDVPAYLQAYQDQLDEAIKPWKKEL